MGIALLVWQPFSASIDYFPAAPPGHQLPSAQDDYLELLQYQVLSAIR